MFKRKVYDDLLNWKTKSEGKTAVLLEGARRIGKTTVVKEFAKNEYDDYMILDFARESKDIRNNFIDNMDDLDAFFRNLFLLKGRGLNGKKCVLIFDEVQLFPPARQAIKYLVADGRYEYIETGSLISIRKNVQNILIPSEEYRIKMYPMDFEEYLWAIGDTISFDAIKNTWYAEVKKFGEKYNILAIVGNKSDLYEDEKVSEDEGREYAKEIGANFFIVSACTGDGIDEMFSKLGDLYLSAEFEAKKNIINRERKNSVTLKKCDLIQEKSKSDKSGGCCA